MTFSGEAIGPARLIVVDQQGLDNTGDSTWDHLIGTWGSDEAVELDEALQDSEPIDESFWR